MSEPSTDEREAARLVAEVRTGMRGYSEGDLRAVARYLADALTALLAARPAVDVEGAGAQALRDAAEAYTDYDDDRGAAMVARRWLRARADSLAATRVPRPAVDVEGLVEAWDRGYTSGHSRAMRKMSDEPNVEPGVNPYRLAGEGR